jgi:hypothetical protein
MIAIDQYGGIHRIAGKHPRAELLAKFDRKHADKMYVGEGVHIGYVIAGLWLALYQKVVLNSK